MLRCAIVVGVVLLAAVPSYATNKVDGCGYPPGWPCPTVPAPSWFNLAYWDNLIFNCAENSICREFGGQPNGIWQATTEAVQNMNIHIAITADPPLTQEWIDTYQRVIPGLMEDLAGGQRWLGELTVGLSPMERSGWIDIVFDQGGCGSGGYWRNSSSRSRPFGQWDRGIVRLNTNTQSGAPDWWCLKTVLLAHEMGHVIGLYHVTDPNDVMCTDPVSRTGDCNGGAWEQSPHSQPRFGQKALQHIQLAREVSYEADEGGWFPYPGVLLQVVPTLPGWGLIVLGILMMRKRLTCRL